MARLWLPTTSVVKETLQRDVRLVEAAPSGYKRVEVGRLNTYVRYRTYTS